MPKRKPQATVVAEALVDPPREIREPNGDYPFHNYVNVPAFTGPNAGAQEFLKRFRAERKAALEKLDMVWMRAVMKANNPRAKPDPDTLLLNLHKHRYHCTDIAPKLRHESGAFLRQRGFTECWGMPMLPEGSLPR